VFGVRIDGSSDVCFERVRVADVRNYGAPGLMRALPGEPNDVAASYVGAGDGGHPMQAPQYGYLGADARGISVAGSERVHFASVTIDGVHSHEGSATGIDFFNSASNVHVGHHCAINDVTTLVDSSERVRTGRFANGPAVGAAIGVHCSGGAARSVYGGQAINVTNVVTGAFEQAHFASIGVELTDEQVAQMHPNAYTL